MKLDEQRLTDLLRLLEQTEENELNCDGCLAAVAKYAECELAGKTPDEALHQVSQHLAICADCREEYAALLNAIRGMAQKSSD